MKQKLFLLLSIVFLLVNCKKEKEKQTTPTPTPAAPTANSVSVRISLIDVGAASISNPRMIGVKVSPTGVQGDTVFNKTIINWAQLTMFPSADTDFNSVYHSFPSDSIMYTGVNDGSYIRIYFFEGSTWKHAVRAYYGSGDISSNSSAGGCIEHYVYSPPLITLSW